MKRIVAGLLAAVCVAAMAHNSMAATATSSSVQEDRFGPEQAIDGNRATRWSSRFADPEWITVDLGDIRDLSGVIIDWEAAFGEVYDVRLSTDGSDFRTVFSEKRGDGNRDFVYFKGQPARFIKILGLKRGTAWGYSIFEILPVFTADAPALTASSNADQAPAALDGDLSTAWTADRAGAQTLTVDFQREIRFGGFVVHTGDNTIVSRAVHISGDGAEWKLVYSSSRTSVGADHLFLPETAARYVRLEMTSAERPLAVRDITVKAPEERASPQRFFELAAASSAPGLYPRWLRKQQEYWTIVGAVDDDQESLLSEDGVLEPWHRSHTVAPFLRVNGRFLTPADAEIEQSLEDDFLPAPAVTWKFPDYELIISAFTADTSQRSSTYLTYSIRNKSGNSVAGEFYLAVRPFQVNPPWMHGGLAEIRSIDYDRTGPGMMKINQRNCLFVPKPPDTYTTAAFRSKDRYGDVIEDIRVAPTADDSPMFRDALGYGSAALAYAFDVPPGGAETFYFAVPLHDAAHEIDWDGRTPVSDYVAGKRKHTLEFWRETLSRIRIELPDPEFMLTVKSSVAYILMNDDRFRLQPGSRNYESSWMRDGALTARALLALGYNEEVRRYLNWISGFVREDGWVPFIVTNHDKIETHGWEEFDSQGEYIYALMEYYGFTKDREFLKARVREVASGVRFIKQLRAKRKTPEYEQAAKKKFYGLFPESASHEGYIDPPRHSYWDVFWGVKGMADAAAFFEILGDTPNRLMADEERVDFQKCLYESIDEVVRDKKIDHMPGCAELGDADPTASAAALWPCEQMPNLPESLVRSTFDRYWNDLQRRFDTAWVGAFTPYEIRSANAFILTGRREQAQAMLEKYFEWKRPRAWNHWAEVVVSEERLAQYLGDMPHTWIAAEFVNVVRNLLIMEDGKALYLGRGIFGDWVRPGRRIAVTNLPTHFGPVSYSVTSDSQAVDIEVRGEVTGADKIVFVIPPAGNITAVLLDGQPYAGWQAGHVAIARIPARITLSLAD